ncbi:MAG: Glu-tRNA(Gln) amidotransferase subunit GatE [Candidatus Latescibacterota bacterium]|nr:MAG: Glu-tRNA(Gln) amidotransferase subunit GatE [Candidatus Latescibacterota bacterium]
MSFEFKPFHEMTPDDYAAIGLKAGLEIHQQLKTEKKLFCRCPAGHYSDAYDAEILRHMRPTLSELGEYDGTALMEFKTKKEIIYRIHRNTVCTYEMDDTPPFMINDEALDIALEVALLLDLRMVNELHIARKQYLDGSIPTGFQRTTILGVEGSIPFKDRTIGIIQLGLEEDACREVSDVGHRRVYLTDRLGMPLIETVTHPDMRTPQEAAEVGEILRKLVRATGKVRTGHGAAREDVNVSIDGGCRIEIKGVPSLARIPLLIYNEAMRQSNLLRIRALLADRGITPSTFASGDFDVTRTVAGTTYAPIQQALERGEQVRCVRLDGYAGILNEKTQTDTTFAKEISDRVRVVACLTGLPNIVHSDAASETLAAPLWQRIRQRVRAKPADAIVLVWGGQEDAESGCNEIAIRAREATEGIPSETRQALTDGTNGFERILPGPDRMYPDTDLPPIALPAKRVEEARGRLPEPPWVREARYREMGLPAEMLEALVASPRAGLFDRVVADLDVPAVLAAALFTQHAKLLKRRGLFLDRLSDDLIYGVFEQFSNGRISRAGVLGIIRHLLERDKDTGDGNAARAAGAEPDSLILGALDDLGWAPVDANDLESIVANVVKHATPVRPISDRDKRHRYLMGILMNDLAGRVDGKEVSQVLDGVLGAI